MRYINCKLIPNLFQSRPLFFYLPKTNAWYMVFKDKYAHWTNLEPTGHLALRNLLTKQCSGVISSVVKWDVVMPCSGNGSCTIGWKRWGLKLSSWKFEVFLAVSPLILVSLVRVFIVHPRNKISSPILLNQERGQLNIPTNFDQSIDNGIFSSQKPWKPLRICGEKLQKSKGAVTSKFQCLKWKEFFAEKFSIFVEQDLEEIHPQYSCHMCYVHPDKICCSSYI